MANNGERYDAALNVWKQHQDASNLSVPGEVGITAILCPYTEELQWTRPASEQYPRLRDVSLSLADKLLQAGRVTRVALRASLLDFEETLRDPQVSDVIVVAHGCLSSFEIDLPKQDNRLDWEDLAKIADHLKTGYFEQRFCGLMPRMFNAPAGVLVVDDHRHVLAPVGKRLSTSGLDVILHDDIVPVTDLPKMTSDTIKSGFPQRKLSLVSRAHVVLGAVKNHVVNCIQES